MCLSVNLPVFVHVQAQTEEAYSFEILKLFFNKTILCIYAWYSRATALKFVIEILKRDSEGERERGREKNRRVGLDEFNVGLGQR